MERRTTPDILEAIQASFRTPKGHTRFSPIPPSPVLEPPLNTGRLMDEAKRLRNEMRHTIENELQST